jgi:hypothetical protein
MDTTCGKSAGQALLPSATTTGPIHPAGSGTQVPVHVLPEVELALVLALELVLPPVLVPPPVLDPVLLVVPIPPGPPSRVSSAHLPKS